MGITMTTQSRLMLNGFVRAVMARNMRFVFNFAASLLDTSSQKAVVHGSREVVWTPQRRSITGWAAIQFK